MSCALLVFAALGSAALEPYALRCEALVDPIGIGAQHPRLSWKLRAPAGATDKRQSAYRILVASAPGRLSPGRADLWDSGVVPSKSTYGIAFPGPAKPFAMQFWAVQVWDESGAASGWSAPARWMIGPLSEADWAAEWVGFDAPRSSLDRADPLPGASWIWHTPESKSITADRRVEIHSGLRRATWTITADNRFVAFVDGVEVGRSDEVTDAWRKPKTFEVSDALKQGAHTLRIQAENEGGPAGVLANLKLEYADGRTMSVATSSEWQVGSGSATPTTPATVVGAYGDAPWGKLAGAPILPPARYVRAEFEVDRQVRRATLHGTALGIADFHLNGRRVGDELFMPGWSDYDKRIYVRSYDVTNAIRAGKNAMGAVLGDGWYSGYVGYGGRRDHYGQKLRVRMQLVLDFADGSRRIVGSGPAWKAATGPILYSDFLMGEHYDARAELRGWDLPGGGTGFVHPVDTGAEFKGSIEPFPGHPVREVAVLQPNRITEPTPGVFVLDLGQNIAGYARIRLRGRAGQKLVLRFGERLSPDGTLYTANLRSAAATDTYVCHGEGLESWSPRFTFHGFQYVEITGLGRKPRPDEVVGVAVTSAAPYEGELETSDAMLNRLVSNARWTQQMNFIDIPTDCPQRDERLGWTGDAQAYVRTATMLADVQPFFTKWLVALDDSQRADGQYPMVAPLKVAGDDGGPAWADAGVICPWTIYDVYGDRELLARHYPQMKKFVEFCRTRSTAEFLPPKEFHCFGDWLNIDAPTPHEVIYTAYFAGSARLLSQAARELGLIEDHLTYRRLYERVRAAFQRAYVSPEGVVRGDTQCAYVLALAFDLLDEPQHTEACRRLVADIDRRGGHLSTGFVGTRDIMHVLSKIGRNDVALRLLHNKTFPSWGFTIQHGATSIWERWDGWTPEKGFQDPGMNSFAHYAFGAVVGWMFEHLGGIQNLEPGFGRVRIRPLIDPKLTWARTRYESVHGPIVTNWRVRGREVTLDVEIPPNVVAEIHVPSGKTERVGSGSHRFRGTRAP